MSYLSIAVKGGYIMIILAILSIAALTIIIEKFLSLKKNKKEKEDFLLEFDKVIQEKDLNRATQLCEAIDSIPISRVYAGVLSNIKSDNVEQTISSGVQREILTMEKGLGSLSTIAAVGPLFGFMGTVLGMIKVFMKIQQTAGGVDISLLAGGIWEALITTVAGLVVGIVALSFYNLLLDKLDYEAVDLQQKANMIIGKFD